jgi:hypothetical protein
MTSKRKSATATALALEQVLEQCDLRQRQGDRSVLKEGPLTLADLDLACEQTTLWPIRADSFFGRRSGQKQNYGYYAVIPRSATQYEILFFLLVPEFLLKKLLVWSCLVKDGRVEKLLFFNGLKVRREDPTLCVYVSGTGNLYARKGWILHRPCVTDDDTRSCDHELKDITWTQAPDALWRYTGTFGRSQTSPSVIFNNIQIDASLQKDDTATTLSDAELTAIFVIAGVWAVVSLIVVVLLFVKVKKRHQLEPAPSK